MMMDEIEVAAVWLLHKRNTKRKVNKKMWVHPINNARLGKGAFHVLSEEIKSDPNKFFIYYRMSATSFEALLNSIESSIEKIDTNMRESISPRERLSLTLR
jgi:hypothetical protein